MGTAKTDVMLYVNNNNKTPQFANLVVRGPGGHPARGSSDGRAPHDPGDTDQSMDLLFRR